MDYGYINDKKQWIMNEIILEYNEWLVKQNIYSMSNGLLNGRMGLCLYWYQQSREFSNALYEKKASHILDEVIRNIGNCTGASFEDGLVGILMSINYLIDEKYIDGNAKTIFTDVNDKLFQYAYFRGIDPVKENDSNYLHLIWVCIYFSKSIRSNALSKENTDIIKRFLIEGINTLEKAIRDNSVLLKPTTVFRPFSYLLPHLLYFIKEMYAIDVYTYKLDMFCLELSKKLQYNIPIDYGNRFMLYTSIKKLTKEAGVLPRGFQDVEKFLFYIIKENNLLQEFRCFDLNLRQGLSGLLFYVYDTINTPYLLNSLEKKIKEYVYNNSKRWMDAKNYNLGDSMTGVIYTYQKLKKYYEKK